MAFVDNQPQDQNAPQGQAPVAAGGQGLIGNAPKAASTPGVNVPNQPSAQLKDYLNANQAQATNFAGQIASDVGGKNQATAQAIPQAVNTYTGQLYNVPTDATVNAQVASSPSGLTDQQKATYQTELGASSKVPNAASTFETTKPYQDLTGKIQKNVETANLWNAGNDPASLSTALQPYETPTATSGDKTLDALLLSGTPVAYGQISHAVAPAAGQQAQLDYGTAQADQSLRSAIANDTASTSAANQAAQTYAQNLTAYLNNAVKEAQANANATNAGILADVQNNAPNPTDIKNLGISPDQWNVLNQDMQAAKTANVPISLSDYLKQITPSINIDNMATTANYADVAAIRGILGGNAPALPIGTPIAGQSGVLPQNVNSFDYAGADTTARLNPLEASAQALSNQEQSAVSSYASGNHFGGQTPDQFNAMIANWNAQLDALNQQIAATSPAGAQWVNSNFEAS